LHMSVCGCGVCQHGSDIRHTSCTRRLRQSKKIEWTHCIAYRGH
jgi:hypothetical protein